jgi:hypothetical protein
MCPKFAAMQHSKLFLSFQTHGGEFGSAGGTRLVAAGSLLAARETSAKVTQA